MEIDKETPNEIFLLPSYLFTVITLLHVMQTRYSDENSSVCPSVCDETEERSVQIFIPYDHLAWFSEKETGWSGRPLLPEILG